LEYKPVPISHSSQPLGTNQSQQFPMVVNTSIATSFVSFITSLGMLMLYTFSGYNFEAFLSLIPVFLLFGASGFVVDVLNAWIAKTTIEAVSYALPELGNQPLEAMQNFAQKPPPEPGGRGHDDEYLRP